MTLLTIKELIKKCLNKISIETSTSRICQVLNAFWKNILKALMARKVLEKHLETLTKSLMDIIVLKVSMIMQFRRETTIRPLWMM